MSLAGESCRLGCCCCWLEVETPRGRARRKEPKIVVERTGGPLASLINTGDVASMSLVVVRLRGYFSGALVSGTNVTCSPTYSHRNQYVSVSPSSLQSHILSNYSPATSPTDTARIGPKYPPCSSQLNNCTVLHCTWLISSIHGANTHFSILASSRLSSGKISIRILPFYPEVK